MELAWVQRTLLVCTPRHDESISSGSEVQEALIVQNVDINLPSNFDGKAAEEV